jgi:hypothetical protein
VAQKRYTAEKGETESIIQRTFSPDQKKRVDAKVWRTYFGIKTNMIVVFQRNPEGLGKCWVPLSPGHTLEFNQ